ncbi:MAG: hypothetical protein AAGK14_15545 [Verrucomicrobiota bacterium]
MIAQAPGTEGAQAPHPEPEPSGLDRAPHPAETLGDGPEPVEEHEESPLWDEACSEAHEPPHAAGEAEESEPEEEENSGDGEYKPKPKNWVACSQKAPSKPGTDVRLTEHDVRMADAQSADEAMEVAQDRLAAEAAGEVP